MKTCLKIAFISYYSVTLLLCSEQPRPEVKMRLDRGNKIVHIYAPKREDLHYSLHYQISVKPNELIYSIYPRMRFDRFQMSDGQILEHFSKCPTLDNLKEIKNLVNTIYIEDEIIMNTIFSNKLSKQVATKKTDEDINNENIFSLYKILCIYIPTKRGYLDHLLAPLPLTEQDEIRILNKQREPEQDTEPVTLIFPYKTLKERLAERYNAITRDWQLWTMPKFEKHHIWGLAGLGVGVGVAGLGAYYMYKYPRQQVHIQ